MVQTGRQWFDSAAGSLTESAALVRFASENATADTAVLKLKWSGKSLPFDLDFALVQIAARRKNTAKLPLFLSNPDFLFPSDIAAQQATDQSVARFHASLATSRAGASLRWADLTAGLGIDAMSAAMARHRVTALEIESWKCDVLRHNASVMQIPEGTLQVVCADCTAWLDDQERDSQDVIFIDPARRGEGGRRVFGLADCFPDAVALMPKMLRVAPMAVVKCSPMLDVIDTLRRLPHISDIYAVDVKGECKELLAVCRRGFEGASTFHAVEITPDGQTEFSWQPTLTDVTPKGCGKVPSEESLPGMYLYEPSAAMLKLQSDRALADRYPDLLCAGANTRLYFSRQLHPDFPGRVGQVEEMIHKKDMLRWRGRGASVVSRNHPMGADEIRKRLSLRESTDIFVYAFRLDNTPLLLATRRLVLPPKPEN